MTANIKELTETTNLKAMKLNKQIFLVLAAIAMISCDNNPTDNSRLNYYPMTVGSTWTYDKKMINNYYKSPTSDIIERSDTLSFEGTTWIEKDTIINKSRVMVFKTKENDFYQPVTTTNYQFMDDNGLKLVAYSYGGSMLSNSSANAFIKPTFHASTDGKMNTKSQINSGVYVYSTPMLSVKYPLTIGSEWTSASSFKIDKKVIGMDTLHINGHDYACFKILWKYPEGYTLNVTEWIAKEGILKREVNNGITYITDEQGNNLIKIASTEVMTIKSVTIK